MEESASTNGGPGHHHHVGGGPSPGQGGPTSNGVGGDRETASVSPPTISAGSVSAASAVAAASVQSAGVVNPLQNPSKLYEEAAAATAAAAGLTSLGSHLHSASSYMNMSQAYPYSMMGNGPGGPGVGPVGQMENSVVTSSCSGANPASGGGYSYSPASNMSPSCMSMNNGQPPQATTPTGKKNNYFQH